jgi:hypothetical protein
MSTNTSAAKTIQRTPYNFALRAGGVDLRPYQVEPINAIWNSIRTHAGLTFVIVISRQSGKDELLCHLKTYLLQRYQFNDVEIVEFNPTYKPQTIRAITRLESRMQTNILLRNRWKKRSDFMRFLGQACVSFLSGDGQANVVGAVASLLLIINEAQDITVNKYDKDAAPMAASTNATRIFWGTAWTSQTLLGRELRAARRAQEADGIRRVFVLDADQVAQEVPAYGKYIAAQIAKLGRNHPMIRTQYFSEEIDAQAGMFPPARRALIFGDQPAHYRPLPGVPCAFLLDVAGQDEANMSLGSETMNQGRDAVSLSIVDLDLSTLAILQAPTYRVAHRLQWTGQNHLTVFGQLKSLAEAWNPLHIVIDATGVGEGLWALLDKAFPGRVLPVKFSQQEKSEIGYRFLAVIETGRFRDLCPTDAVRAQYEACTSEILLGPQKTLRWGVPESARNPTGELIHDDYLLADALVAILDRLEWIVQTSAESSDGFDPLEGVR